MELDPRRGAEAEQHDGWLRIRCNAQPDLSLHLYANVPLIGLRTSVTLKAGQTAHLLLNWRRSLPPSGRVEPDRLYADTVAAWRRWLDHLEYSGMNAYSL